MDGRQSQYRYNRIDRLSDARATYTVQPNGNRLVTCNGVALTYDPPGNLLSDQARLNGATVESV